MAMAAGRSTQQMWDETVGKLMSLSTATVSRNTELESRVMALEQELAALKRSHALTLQAASPTVAFRSPNDNMSFIHCVIDGDANMFNTFYYQQGERGGAETGQTLAKGVAKYLTSLGHLRMPTTLSFWVTIFLDKRGLQDTLMRRNVCTSEQFEDFWYGFSQSSPRFQVVDVGHGLLGADIKIKEFLSTHLSMSQTLSVFLAASNYDDYRTTLDQLDARRLLDPLVLLDGGDGIPSTLLPLRLPSMKIDGLFARHDVQPLTPPQSSPEISPIGSERLSFSSGRTTPQSPAISTLSVPSSSSSNGPRSVDLTKPLHRQEPPPCNEYYLMSCYKGAACKYSHDYQLSPEQLEVLAVSARKAPCHFLKKGLPCANGVDCCWGHVCPHGSQCFHYSKKKCWFKGEGMHDHAPTNDA